MTGLIIGKFHPPHRGHQYLINTARAHTDKTIVLICQSSTDSIPAELRAAWLQQTHPGITTYILDQDAFDRTHAHAWVKASLDLIHEAPDIVFSSEDYGVLYAELLGCKHYMVDKNREKIPVSASQIMENPLQYLDFLEPSVAAYFSTVSQP